MLGEKHDVQSSEGFQKVGGMRERVMQVMGSMCEVFWGS